MGLERNNYGEGWECFRLDGKSFLALKTRSQVVIWGEMWANYGTHYTVWDFKIWYRKGHSEPIEPAITPILTSAQAMSGANGEGER